MPLKVLVIRFSSIGDIVLTSPVVRCLKRQLDAEIHYLTKKNFSSIATANPYITKVWSIEKDPGEVIAALKEEHFDYIIDLHKNLRSWRVKRALRTTSYTFDKLNFEKWLLVNFKVDRLPRIHIVDRYLQAVAPLGIVNDAKGLDYFIPPEAVVVPGDLLPALAQDQNYFYKNFISKTTVLQYHAVVTGAAHATKCLPEEKIIELCRQLTLPVVLLGGKAEAAAGDRIAARSGLHVVNACGKCSLHGSASLVQQAQKVFTPDTGLMHIAAALGKEIVSFWGNTVPAFGMYPYYGVGKDCNTIVEINGLSCRPCSKIGYKKCPKGHFRCMNDIDMRSVVAGVPPDTIP
jgi:ADP-heptose:LPS heptosyltransferase